MDHHMLIFLFSTTIVTLYAVMLAQKVNRVWTLVRVCNVTNSTAFWSREAGSERPVRISWWLSTKKHSHNYYLQPSSLCPQRLHYITERGVVGDQILTNIPMRNMTSICIVDPLKLRRSLGVHQCSRLARSAGCRGVTALAGHEKCPTRLS
jgi:hypothetical protein